MKPTHILIVHEGADPEALDEHQYWVTEDQAAAFVVQAKDPKAPFALFTDTDGVMRGLFAPFLRYFEVRAVPPEGRPEGANVIPINRGNDAAD